MRLDLISIFPAYFDALDLSLAGKARDAGLLDVRVHDLRAWTHDRHRTVDDTPYGGGAGMVMKPEPWGEALDAVDVGPSGATLVVPTPAGRPFTQALARDLAGPRAPGVRVREVRGGSTSGWPSTPRAGSRCWSCRSATTSSTAARWPPWRSARRSSASCRGSWATPSRSSRSPTRTASWRRPSTPSPRPGAGSRSRRSSSAATTARSRGGATAVRTPYGPAPARPPVAVGAGRRRGAAAGRARRRGCSLHAAAGVLVAGGAGQPGRADPGARGVARRRTALAHGGHGARRASPRAVRGAAPSVACCATGPGRSAG